MNNYIPVDIELIIMAGHYNNKVYDNRAIKKELIFCRRNIILTLLFHGFLMKNMRHS